MKQKPGSQEEHLQFERPFDPLDYTLAELAHFVITMAHPFEDVAEQIEDKAYAECDHGNLPQAVEQLTRLADFFEHLDNKNDEVCRDLADVYVLIGEMYQCVGRYGESLGWFEKAIIIDDSYDVPYHSLAVSYLHLGSEHDAARCWEQEIRIAPGNYYTYLQLADAYEKQGNDARFKKVLEELLERDSGNIRALHRLVMHYERTSPDAGLELLRRRIINADHTLLKRELVIWTFHMCREKRYRDAILYLDNREKEGGALTITHLLKAHLFGKLRLFRRKRLELSAFKRLSHGDQALMQNKIDEFSSVFGPKSAERLTARLVATRPAQEDDR